LVAPVGTVYEEPVVSITAIGENGAAVVVVVEVVVVVGAAVVVVVVVDCIGINNEPPYTFCTSLVPKYIFSKLLIPIFNITKL
jgi:hypothetical protein